MTNQPSVLIIDDEVQIQRLLKPALEQVGFSVEQAKTGTEALRSAALKLPNLVILDLILPDIEGGEVLERLRSWSRVPVIVLSAMARESDKVRLLEAGADDYVVKPFSLAELMARAHSVMRWQARGADGAVAVEIGALRIDFAARKVSVNDVPLTLTRKEYRLIRVLAQHHNVVVSHEFLLKEVWGPEHSGDLHVLRNFVRKLRKKIEVNPGLPKILLTERAVGFRLVTPEPPK